VSPARTERADAEAPRVTADVSPAVTHQPAEQTTTSTADAGPAASSVRNERPAAEATGTVEPKDIGEKTMAESAEFAKNATADTDANVKLAGNTMETMMEQMERIMTLQMKHQTAMALMKLIVDMNNALAKQLKEVGRAVKDLAG
jgi:hypothetical protein